MVRREGTEAEEIAERALGGGTFSVEKFVESFPVLVGAVGGIKRLRGFALKLALAGRIGTWNPIDLPAIQAADGDPPKPYPTRPNWVRCTLPEVAEIEMGNSPPGSSYNDVGNGVPLINGPVEFSPGPLGLTRRTKFTTAPARMCREGDLLVCVRGATTGRTNIAAFDACIGRGVAMVRAKHDQFFINYFMWSVGVDLLAAGTGTTFPAISRDDLVALSVDFPPLAEQKRIVARVDQLMALIDQLEAKQNRKRDLGARFTKASLEALTTAESPQDFTAAWTRIQSTWPTLIDSADKMPGLRRLVLDVATKGLLVLPKPGEDAKNLLGQIGADLPQVAPEDAPFDIPSHWMWMRLGNLGAFVGGGTPSKNNSEFWKGNIPWVSPKDMKRLYIDDAEDHISAEAVDSSATKLIPSPSLLMVLRGMILAHSFPVALTTKTVTINQDMKALVLRVPAIAEFALLACRAARDRVLAKVQRSSHGTCRLESEDVANLPIPIPPLAEQKRIVAKVEHLMKLCDALEASLRRSEDRSAKLAEAVVQEMVA